MIGVYYLWDGSSVIYIGASVNVERRIQRHCSSGMDFCGYFCDECDVSELDQRECDAIREYDRLTTRIRMANAASVHARYR